MAEAGQLHAAFVEDERLLEREVAFLELLAPALTSGQRCANNPRERMRQLRGVTAAHRDPAAEAGEGRTAIHDVDAPAQALHARSRRGAQPIVQAIDPAAELILRGDDE